MRTDAAGNKRVWLFSAFFSAFRVSSLASRRVGPDPEQRGTGVIVDGRHDHNIVSGCGPERFSSDGLSGAKSIALLRVPVDVFLRGMINIRRRVSQRTDGKVAR
jgi:hypothetical protein